jgi:hypothetical protein
MITQIYNYSIIDKFKIIYDTFKIIYDVILNLQPSLFEEFKNKSKISIFGKMLALLFVRVHRLKDI